MEITNRHLLFYHLKKICGNILRVLPVYVLRELASGF